MGIMIIPFVSSLSDDVINAVPIVRDGSPASARPSRKRSARWSFPAALPGIVSAMLLAVSRAIGETMIVVMAAGLAATDGQPVRGGDHGDRADRVAAGRRPGVRQRQDARRLRTRPGAVRITLVSTSSRCASSRNIENNMTDAISSFGAVGRPVSIHTDDAAKARLKGRYSHGNLVQMAWRRSCGVQAGLFLVLLLSTIVTPGDSGAAAAPI